jgi:hypothetical protein
MFGARASENAMTALPLPADEPMRDDATRAERRDQLFRETLEEAVRRNLLGIAWGLKPPRTGGFLPGLAFIAKELAFGGRGCPIRTGRSRSRRACAVSFAILSPKRCSRPTVARCSPSRMSAR